jgi:hypothetical protein
VRITINYVQQKFQELIVNSYFPIFLIVQFFVQKLDNGKNIYKFSFEKIIDIVVYAKLCLLTFVRSNVKWYNVKPWAWCIYNSCYN